METQRPFFGNLIFASKNAFMGNTLSRRDDLISLVYLLYFFIQGNIQWIGRLPDDEFEEFKFVGRRKIEAQPKDICIGAASGFLEFAEAVFKLKFAEEPNYKKLQHLLIKHLYDFDLCPTNRFDWS